MLVRSILDDNWGEFPNRNSFVPGDCTEHAQGLDGVAGELVSHPPWWVLLCIDPGAGHIRQCQEQSNPLTSPS